MTVGLPMYDGCIAPCEYCGQTHIGVVCPRIRLMEFGAGGRILRVEFHDVYATSQDPRYVHPLTLSAPS